MYYPLSQITPNLHTNGNEYVIISTQEDYIGYYWKNSKGQLFTGKTPQDTPTEELMIPEYSTQASQIKVDTISNSNYVTILSDADVDPYIINPNEYAVLGTEAYLSLKNIDVNSVTLLPSYTATLPTQQDYKNTEFRRYFCKKANEIIYLEISKETYDKLVAQDPQILFQLYIPFNLPWQLTGAKEKVYKTNLNIVELTIQKNNLYKFNEYLKFDYTKYYK